jgi:hypothetical protein
MHLYRAIARRRHGTGVAGEFGFGASSSCSQDPRSDTRHGPTSHAIQAQLHVPWASRPDSIYSAASGPGTSCLHHQLRVKRFSPDGANGTPYSNIR